MAEGERKVVLYVKANDKLGKGLGDCPFSHRIMMILNLKQITCKYIPVHLKIIPQEFKEFCNNAGIPIKVPVLVHGEYVVYNSNDIAYYIDKEWPDPPLVCENEMASKIGDNVFTKFCGYLRNKNPAFEEKEQEKLVDELKKLNNFLGSVNSPGTFLNGDTMQHPDCDLLPKLQHVKVALRKYKKFEIPAYLAHLIAYMDAAAQQPSFASTCPSDEAIVEGWRKHFV